MPGEKHVRVFLAVLYGGLALGGLWLGTRFVLPWAAPFLAGGALAALVEPVVRVLTQRVRLPRWGAAALCIAVLAGSVLGAAALLLWRLVYEAGVLLARLPALLAGTSALVDWLDTWSYRVNMALPAPLREAVQGALAEVLEEGLSLPEHLYNGLAGAAAGVAGSLPGASLFLFTALLAGYFISAGWPDYREWLRGLLPASWREPVGRGWAEVRRTLGGWLRAQGLLMLVTFGELAAGLLLLRVELFLLLAALIALVDALPVFGTGTVLLPWAAAELLAGRLGLALGLAALYGVVSVVRSVLEPKLVGEQTGLPPLGALAAMYAGFQTFGVAGMILAPLLASVACQLWRLFRPSLRREG